MLSGDFEVEESIDSLAVREVNEEVGLTLKQENLQNIGISQVRLLNQKTDEMWWIQYYVYYADGTEGTLTQCDEGTLEFVPISEINQRPMSLHDRIIFNEKSPSLFIQSIDDDIHNIKQLRISQKKSKPKNIHIVTRYSNNSLHRTRSYNC